MCITCRVLNIQIQIKSNQIKWHGDTQYWVLKYPLSPFLPPMFHLSLVFMKVSMAHTNTVSWHFQDCPKITIFCSISSPEIYNTIFSNISSPEIRKMIFHKFSWISSQHMSPMHPNIPLMRRSVSIMPATFPRARLNANNTFKPSSWRLPSVSLENQWNINHEIFQIRQWQINRCHLLFLLTCTVSPW